MNSSRSASFLRPKLPMSSANRINGVWKNPPLFFPCSTKCAELRRSLGFAVQRRL